MSNEQQKYTDVGMLIPGAPKLRAKAMVDSLDFTSLISNVTDSLGLPVEDAFRVVYDMEDKRQHHLLEEWQQGLTKDKLWRQPAYADLLEKGVPAQAIGFIKELRDALPRHAHRPTPETLKAFSEMVGIAREFTDTYLGHWENAVKAFADDPPSYGRVAQIAALSLDLSDRNAYVNSNGEYYPAPITDPLPPATELAIRDGFSTQPNAMAAIEEIKRAFDEYTDADLGQGRTYSVSGPSPARQSLQAIRKSGRSLSSLEYSVGDGPFTVSVRPVRMAVMRAQRSDKVDNDRVIGYKLPLFKELKLKPATLGEPHPAGMAPAEETGESKKKATTKPRRPQRLTAAEAKALLRSPEDDGEDSERFQDLNSLIDMGMVRGIQWGEWVPQKERATLVKNIFDGFQHFAEGMQITPSLAGLGNPVSAEQREQTREDGLYESDFTGNESLGLALGARGKSSAAAHYEPGLHAINLTRLNGAGALAHEMFHGLDYKLTQLIDLGKANRRHSSSDVRKTTASKRGITTFSQMIAHHWWLKTYKTDRHQIDPSDPDDFKQENQDLITEHLRFEVAQDDELTSQVMPLMVGVAEFIREMYHQPREPEEMLDKELDRAAGAITTMNFSSKMMKSSFAGITHPSMDTGDTSRGAMSMLAACQKILPQPHADRLQSNISGALESSFYADTPDLLRDLSNWSVCDFTAATEDLSMQVASYASQNLESILERDLVDKQKSEIRSYITDTFEAAGIQTLIFEAATRKVRDINSPPLPDTAENNTPERKEALDDQVEAALKETLATAPLELISRIEKVAENTNSGSSAWHENLAGLSPTSQGKIAGLKDIDLKNVPAAGEWQSGMSAMRRIAIPLEARSRFEGIHALRRICDARKTPPQRELQQPCGRLLEAFEATRQGFNTAINNDLHFADNRAVYRLREAMDLPKEASLRDIIKKMPSHPEDHEGYRALNDTMQTSYLAWASVAAAYTDSALNDGRLATFSNVMQNPTLLGDDMPNFLPDLYAYIYQTNSAIPRLPVGESADWSSPETINSMARAVAKNSNREIGSPSPIFEGRRQYMGGTLSKLDRESTGVVMMASSAIKQSFINGDTTHLEAMDSAIDDIGASFRYMPGDDRRDVIASFFENPDQVRAQLSSEHFIEAIHSTEPPPAFFVEKKPENVAQNIISTSQNMTAELRKNKGAGLVMDSLDFAKKLFPRLRLSSRAPSETLLHSASYDDAQVNPSPFIINPGSKRGYWYSAVEMFARCSEAALSDTLESKGISSPYLVTVPSKKSQEAALASIAGGQARGQSNSLNYPAGDERERFAGSFQKNVIPNMEAALNALFPDAKPAYEAYLKRSEALEARETMIQRLDAEPDERMMAQEEPAYSEAPATDEQAHKPGSPSHTTPDAERGTREPDPAPPSVGMNETPSLF